MKRLAALIFTGVILLTGAVLVSAQGQLSPEETQRIIKAFTLKEEQYRLALRAYGFKRDAKLQSIGFGGQVTGEYHRISTFSLDDAGTKREKIIFFPQPTLSSVTAEDLEDLSGVNPYALEVGKAHLYNFTYVGQERIDEIDLYVFEVAPKVIPDPKKTKERLFSGRVWVDTIELQIVKSKGKGVPETKTNKFPNVVTWREQIDGKFWFPSYLYANEQLVFDNGSVLHVKMEVKISDYKRFGSRVKIIEDEEPEIVDEGQTPPAGENAAPVKPPTNAKPSTPAPTAKPTPTPAPEKKP